MSADLVMKPTISQDGLAMALIVESAVAFRVAYQLDNGPFLLGPQGSYDGVVYRLNTGMMPLNKSVKITTFDNLQLVIKRFASDNDKLSSSLDVLFAHHDPFNIVEYGTPMVWPASFYGADYRQDLVMWRGLTVTVRGQGFDQNVIVS